MSSNLHRRNQRQEHGKHLAHHPGHDGHGVAGHGNQLSSSDQRSQRYAEASEAGSTGDQRRPLAAGHLPVPRDIQRQFADRPVTTWQIILFGLSALGKWGAPSE